MDAYEYLKGLKAFHMIGGAFGGSETVASNIGGTRVDITAVSGVSANPTTLLNARATRRWCQFRNVSTGIEIVWLTITSSGVQTESTAGVFWRLEPGEISPQFEFNGAIYAFASAATALVLPTEVY